MVAGCPYTVKLIIALFQGGGGTGQLGMSTPGLGLGGGSGQLGTPGLGMSTPGLGYGSSMGSLGSAPNLSASSLGAPAMGSTFASAGNLGAGGMTTGSLTSNGFGSGGFGSGGLGAGGSGLATPALAVSSASGPMSPSTSDMFLYRGQQHQDRFSLDSLLRDDSDVSDLFKNFHLLE